MEGPGMIMQVLALRLDNQGRRVMFGFHQFVVDVWFLVSYFSLVFAFSGVLSSFTVASETIGLQNIFL